MENDAVKKPAKPRKRRLSPAETARIAEIFRRFEAASPDPRTELAYKTPYTLLVAVVLSAQATDKSVNKATEKLYAIANTPQQMLALGEAGLTPYIASIGLFRMKAKNVVALSRILIEQYGGEVPLNREALQRCPASAARPPAWVLNELRVEPAIAVDTPRLPRRASAGPLEGQDAGCGRARPDGDRPRPPQDPSPPLADPARRYVCVARKPKCAECLVADLCPSRSLFLGA